MASRDHGPTGRSGPDTEHRPVDPSRRATVRPADLPTRDPTAYAGTDHFHERLGQAGRYVSLPAVSEAIRRGQLRWNTTDGWRFALVSDGVRLVVVVGDTATPSPVVVTAWTEVADWEAAMAADRWSATDVHTIQLRADLSGDPDRQVPDSIRPRSVRRPFRVGRHEVATRAGESHVECVHCGGRFRSKRALRDRACGG